MQYWSHVYKIVSYFIRCYLYVGVASYYSSVMGCRSLRGVRRPGL